MAKRGRPFYIYELIDPRDGVTFYVGKGVDDRISQHERQAARGVRSAKCDRINEIVAAGFEIEKRIIRRFHDEEVAYRFEKARIKRIGLGNLTNVAPGGRAPITDEAARNDRNMARALANIIVKTGCFSCLPRWRFCGEWHDLPVNFNEVMKGHFLALVNRRGVYWFNQATKGQLRLV